VVVDKTSVPSSMVETEDWLAPPKAQHRVLTVFQPLPTWISRVAVEFCPADNSGGWCT
jgi:hypothetical protein